MQASLDEAGRLDKLVESLYQQGKFQEAVRLAKRGLELREKALGPRHPDVASSLSDLAGLYRQQGEYAQAEPLTIQALEIREQALGTTHPDVAESLNNLAGLYREQGAYARAEPLFVRALAIWEQALGRMHPDVAISLNNLAMLYWAQGAYARAEPLLVRALAIREKALGMTHPVVATSLNNLAMLYQAQGAYARAEPLYARALDIRETALGPMHPDVASSLGNLAMLYQDQGVYARVEQLLLRALDIGERSLGPMHPRVALSLNNLAGHYHTQGAHARAEPLYVRALAIKEKMLGATHPDVATSVNNLAMLYRDRGAYARAEPLYVRALDVREKALGSMHPAVADSVDNLALLYRVQGAYAQAEPLHTRALDIREKALGPMHPAVATSLNNLALLYQAQGAHARAAQFYSRALDILEKALGSMHPDVATSLNNLALLYQTQGAYARAESFYVRALAIREKVLGTMHPDVATNLNNLAGLYQAQGAYARAEPLHVRALAVREKALGEMHPDVANSLLNLAALYEAQGAYARVEPLLARAAEIREGDLRIELAPRSESRKWALMTLLRGETQSVVSFHAHSVPASKHTLELALTTVLRRKGRTLDVLADHQAGLRAHLTPPLRDKLGELAEVYTQLSTRLRAPYDPRTAESRASALAALRTRIDELEGELNAASAVFRAQSEPVTVAKVQATLSRGAALVEIVRYHRFDSRRAQPWQEARYLAYLLPWRGPPRWIALGEAAAIDSRVDTVLAAMRTDASAAATRAALRSLDALVFAPIRRRLAGISHVIVSPDDKLNLVPFEALIDAHGRYALERWLVSYVTSGRDLLRLAARQTPRTPATIIADPDYGPGKPFARLAGTLVEAKEVEGYLRNARTLTGDQATKAALASITGPAVLHVATHGFYANGSVAPAQPTAAERGMSVEAVVSPPSEEPIDALDRAGLALAGANIRPDGIASARELASYDWWGTQLVVLSACETGVGAVPSGQGVYGMRRALVLAGAQSQVVSLWNVNDASTRELMRELYAELARGTGRAEALRRAKLTILRRKPFAHPYYWAAFIPAGDWTPLDKDTLQSPVRP